MIIYVLRKLLEDWYSESDLIEIAHNKWVEYDEDFLLGYYTYHREDIILQAYILIKSWVSNYAKEARKFSITGNWLRKRFSKLWLPVIKKKVKWIVTWECENCWGEMKFYHSRNRKYCSKDCYHCFNSLLYSKWGEESHHQA